MVLKVIIPAVLFMAALIVLESKQPVVYINANNASTVLADFFDGDGKTILCLCQKVDAFRKCWM
jgi:hypothetical protein